MNSKKHGKEYSQAEMAEDFYTAAECTYELIEEFEEMGLSTGPAIGGALTQLLSYLIATAPDSQTAMGLLSSCITNATLHSDNTLTTHPGSDEIH